MGRQRQGRLTKWHVVGFIQLCGEVRLPRENDQRWISDFSRNFPIYISEFDFLFID